MTLNGRTANRRQNDRRKNVIVKATIMLILGLLLLVFAVLGWFALNKIASTTGMGIDAKDFPFEIEASGSAPSEYVRLFGLADNTFSAGDQQGNTSAFRTGSTDKIWWRVDGNDDSSYKNGFRPGASGSLEFSIIPKDTNAQVVNCSFDIRAFVATENSTTGAIESMTEITSTSGTNAQKSALNYLGGHILFFENMNVVDGHEVYSGLIGADGLNVSVPAGGASVSVTVYWKWVNTFDQMFLKTTDTYYDYPLIADNNTSDRTALTTYIQTNSSNIFSGLSSADSTAVGSISYSSDHNNSSLLSALNDGYNAADQMIGVNLHYFLIEMNATAGTNNAA